MSNNLNSYERTVKQVINNLSLPKAYIYRKTFGIWKNRYLIKLKYIREYIATEFPN